jgi:hypothetical protein
MASKNTAVFGIYPSRTAAEEAVGHLRNAGFRSTDPSALFPENQGTKDLAHEKHTKAPEGVTAGAIAGVLIGGVLSWLIGRGVWIVPGLEPFTVAGPMVAALAGAGALGILGGILGALIGLGTPEYEARRFEGRIREGGVLLSVHCDNHDWVKRAKEVLEHTGARKIAAAVEKSGDFANADKPLPRIRTADTAAANGSELLADRPPQRLRPAPGGGLLSGEARPSATGSVLTGDEVVSEKTTRIRPSASSGVVAGDDLYTERVVRRRTVQDPEKLE